MRISPRFFFAFIVILSLYFIEQVVAWDYVWKLIAKVALMLSPLLFIRKFPSMKMTSKTPLAFGLSAALIAVILVAYFILAAFIDLQLIAQDLIERGVSAQVFLFVAVYILVVNSFIEEYFFRDYLQSNPFVSSAVFAIYHVTIFLGWFSAWILALVLFGLFVGGLIFHYVNEKKTMLNGLIVHIGADIGIVIIGLLMFGFF